jgi:two-component sensor histidine kinase
MSKFYVYSLIENNDDEDDRSCIYVDERLIHKFAEYEFDPECMQYSGVMIEADSPQQAHHIYNTFEGGEIISAAEPKWTVRKRKTANEMKEAVNHLQSIASQVSITAQAKSVYLLFMQINERISAMSRQLKVQFQEDEIDITELQVYRKLKKKYIEVLEKMKYENDKRGDAGGSAVW